ncbi:MAG: AMP-binding protein [Clostridia bacterium]|nr:AMP-binding protein [Clostridia bacterium]
MGALEVRDIKDMLKKTGDMYGNRPAYKFKTNIPGEFKTISHKQIREMVDNLGTALTSLLNLKGKRIAIIGENRYEWEVAYFSIVAGTGIVVPLDKALPSNELESLIRRADVEAIFYSRAYGETLKKIVKDGTTTLKHLICFDTKEHEDDVYSFKELVEKGKTLKENGEKSFISAGIDPDKMSIMLFTSGTTSQPKAVVLSQKNICANLFAMKDIVYDIDSTDTFLSVLPVHHVFECSAGFMLAMYLGACTAFSTSLRHIVDDIRDFKVSFLVCVPALYELMYKGILGNLKKAGKLEAVMQLAEAHKNDSMEKKAKIFKDVHAIFGGCVKLFISGAAALDVNVERGYRNFGINIVQGYGLTEASPVVCCNRSEEKDENKHVFGSIGKVVINGEAKIDNPNEDGLGELLFKGPNVMLGYYGDEDATKSTIDLDGWLHTGDLCTIDENGYIFIKGRKKSVIVLKNGKNIYPEEMENLINKIEGVDESMIYSFLNKDAADENDIKIGVEVVYNKDIMKDMYNVESEDEIYEIINNKVKEINKTMPAYKSIRNLIITQVPIAKTTTGKIKRYEELDKINISFVE